MNIYDISKDEHYKDQNQIIEEFSTPFGIHLNEVCFEEHQKKSIDDFSPLSSPTILKQPMEEKKIGKRNPISKFFIILQKKINKIRENQKKFSLFQNVYKEKILLDDYNQKQKQSKYQINPKNSIMLTLQYVKCISMVIILVILPFLWSFSDFNMIRDKNIEIIISLILLLDMSSQFNQAIIFRGQIIYDRVTICKNYFSKQFFEDTIFIVSFILLVRTEQTMFVISFYISGIIILLKIIRKLEDMFDLSKTHMEILKLVRLLFLINLLAHFIACIWFFVGKNTVDFDNNWLDSKGIRDKNIYVQYIYSFYWSVVTMVTVGYGDITPQNYVEMLVCIFIMLFSCGVYGYSLNVIGQIVSTFNHQSEKLESVIRALNKYFKKHNIKDELQSRIKNYLEYKIKEEELQNDNIYIILNQLSSHLKFKLISDVYQGMLQQCPLLQENFSRGSLINSSRIIQTLNFEPEDFIINQNSLNENALYIIDSGLVQLYEQRSKTVICEFSCGQIFGEFEFFTNSQAKFSIKCKSRTKVFKLSRQSFIDSLSKDDFERFHQIKHCFEFNIPIKQQQCQACQQVDHLTHNCSILFFQPNLSKQVKLLESLKQQRKVQIRRRERYNCFKFLKLCQEKQFEFNQQYQQEIADNARSEDEFIIVGGDSQIISLLQNNIMKYSDSQEVAIPSFRKLNTTVRTKQSLPDQSSQEPVMYKSTTKKHIGLSMKNSEIIESNTFVHFDRMKEYQNFFGENNFDNQIRRYNQQFFNNSLVATTRRKMTRAMKFIQI